MASVELIDVAKRYGKQTVLSRWTSHHPRRQLYRAGGPFRRCGKSTLLRPAGRSRNAFRRHHS